MSESNLSGMSHEEYEKAKAEFDKTKTPYLDLVFRDGSRFAGIEYKAKNSHLGCGGGGIGKIPEVSE